LSGIETVTILFDDNIEDGESPQLVGSIQVQSQGDRFVGDIIFGTRGNLEAAAAMPLQGRLFKQAVFNHVASDKNYFTGLALFVPGEDDAAIQIEVYDNTGKLTGQTQLTLQGGHRISKLISELIPEVKGQVGGFIQVTSDQDLVAQQLFASTKLSFLSAVPPTIVR
jgi:hypothetical protein